MDYSVVAKMLDLRDVEITHIEIENDAIHICIKSTKEPECAECHSKNVYVHDIYIREDIRDRSVFDKKCFLEIEEKIIACRDCKRKKREILDFINPNARQTNRYRDYIAKLGFELNISSISTMEDIGYRAVEYILQSYTSRHRPVDMQGCIRIGIDEFAVLKGHKNFCVMIANLDKSKPIVVLPDRKEITIRRYLSSIPLEQRNAVIEVSLDMWSQYISLAEEFFPKARIVIDRFHVMKHVSAMMDKIRVCEYKLLTKDEKKSVKGIRWIMYKRYRDLDDSKKEILRKFLSMSKRSKKAYKLKEEFVHTMDKITDVKKGKILFEKWLDKVEKLKTKKATTLVKTFRSLIEYIVNYFRTNTTNSTLEGMINKIKAIKRKAFGVPNPYHLAMRIYLAFEEKSSLYSTV